MSKHKKKNKKKRSKSSSQSQVMFVFDIPEGVNIIKHSSDGGVTWNYAKLKPVSNEVKIKG